MHARFEQQSRRRVRAGIRCLLAVVSGLTAWLSGPIQAEVIDDFGGPRKFAVNGSTSAAEYALVNGQLKMTLPTGGEYATTAYMRTYVLPEGQPVEFRVDLVSINGDSTEAVVWVEFSGRPYYAVLLSYHRIRLWKYTYEGTGCVFIDQDLSAPTEPLTWSSTFTRLGSSLKVASKVVPRDRPEEVVADLELLDTTGLEDGTWGTDSGGPPTGPITFVGLQCDGRDQVGRAEAVFDNLECSIAPTPETVTVRSTASGEVELGWMGNGIALEAESPLGPWRPCPDVVEGAMNRQRIALSPGKPGRFFRYASGVPLAPGFTRRGDWYIGPSVAGGTWAPALSVVGGVGRILGEGDSNEDYVLSDAEYGLFGILYGDGVASVDIVGWDPAMEDAAIGLVLRARPSTVIWDCRTDGLPQDRYAGLVTFKTAGSPGESVLSLTGPGGEIIETQRFPALDPARQYRLRFWAVEERLTLELFDLSDLETPVVTCAATDSRITEGLAALYGTKSASGWYDVTVNRFVLNATTR